MPVAQLGRDGLHGAFLVTVQKPLRFGLTVVLSPPDRRRVVAGVAQIRVRPPVEQRFDDREVAPHRRLVQWGGPFTRVDIEAKLDQEPDTRQVVAARGPDQLPRLAGDRALDEGRVAGAQCLRRLAVARRGRRHKRLDVVERRARAGDFEHRHDLRVARYRGLLDRRAALVDRMAAAPPVRVDTMVEQPPYPVGEALAGRRHQRILDHLPRGVLSLAPQPSPPAAVAAAEPELEQQLEPLVTREAAQVVNRLTVVGIGPPLAQ